MCALCLAPLGRYQKMYCSQRCRRGDAPALRAMVTLFEAVRGQWMTVSDLAIWLYGDDTYADRDAVLTTLSQVRQRGYVFERRIATWDLNVKGSRYAWRLVGTPADRTVIAA